MLGKVFLVGAGPGDPGLITVKGLRCLKSADTIVYDRLMDPSLLELAPKSAEYIFVGKERGRQALTQDQINELLVSKAQEGKSVVRLKGGDPFVFGRGGEEAIYLSQNNISFEIVPGITSAIAAAAYAGIPVTHRGLSTLFTVVSGSEDPSKPESTVPWDVLARTGGTLVILMGWTSLNSILETLKNQGMAPDTPVELIQWGTWTKQKTVSGNLSNIMDKGKTAGLSAPVIAIVGSVASLKSQVEWFNPNNIDGRKVLITRSRTQVSRLKKQLEEIGAEPIELPSIEIAPLEDYTDLDQALSEGVHLATRWVIFSSTNAVESVFARLDVLGLDSRVFSNAKVAAIGPATALELERRGIKPDFIPSSSPSETVLNELSNYNWKDMSVLLPVSNIGREVLSEGLNNLGAKVTRIIAYRTITPEGISDKAKQLIRDGIDVVTFTSSSTVRNLVNLLDEDSTQLSSSLIACIGPITAKTAVDMGLRVDLIAENATVESLVESLEKYWKTQANSLYNS